MTPSMRILAYSNKPCCTCRREYQQVTYHSRPLPIFKVLFCRPPDTLRFVQTEKAVVELPNHIFRRQKVVKKKLLSQCAHVSSKNRRSIWPEFPRLINGDKDVFKLKRFQLEVSRTSEVAEGRWIKGIFWIPMDRTTICRGILNTWCCQGSVSYLLHHAHL